MNQQINFGKPGRWKAYEFGAQKNLAERADISADCIVKCQNADRISQQIPMFSPPEMTNTGAL